MANEKPTGKESFEIKVAYRYHFSSLYSFHTFLRLCVYARTLHYRQMPFLRTRRFRANATTLQPRGETTETTHPFRYHTRVILEVRAVNLLNRISRPET